MKSRKSKISKGQAATRRPATGPAATILAVALAALVLLAIALFLSGCGDSPAAGDQPAFPEFVYRSEDALDGYRIAAANQPVFDRIPCYCGCKQSPEKYQSLKDCFYNRKTSDFDEHAAGCTTCLDEAKDVGQWLQDGLSAKDIRTQIDAKYSERGDPTDTPMPD